MDTLDLQMAELSDWDRKAMEALAAVGPEVEESARLVERWEEEERAKLLAGKVGMLLGVVIPAEAVQDGILAVGGHKFALVKGRAGNDNYAGEPESVRLLARCSRSGKLAVSPPLIDKGVLAEQLRCFRAGCDTWGKYGGGCSAESAVGRWYWRRQGWGRGQTCAAAYGTLPGQWQMGTWASAWFVIAMFGAILLGVAFALLGVSANAGMAMSAVVWLGPPLALLVFYLATYRTARFKE